MFFLLAATALLFGGFGPPALSQSSRGTISGSVFDAAGAAVAGAKITARNTQTGVAAEAESTDEGLYKVSELPVGIYTITATAQGFKTAELTDVQIEINSITARDIVLEPGAVSETVSVLADSPTVQSESSEVGTVVGRRQVLELPLSNGGFGNSFGLRSLENFAFLAPGVVGPGTASDTGTADGAGQNGGTFNSKISGSQNFSNEVLVDGASVFRSENGSSFDETAPSLEAVNEFKIQTSTLSAEYGRTGGGITSFVIKSGTNDFHGSLYEIFKNRVLNANRFHSNAQGINPATGKPRVPRGFDNSNDFGGVIGGPVFLPRFGEGGPRFYNGRDRTFFFFSYEGFRRSQGNVNTSTIPTSEFLQGNFSALLNPARSGNARAGQPLTTTVGGQAVPVLDALGRPIIVGQIYDPATARTVNGVLVRDPFPGNIIPRSRFSGVAQNVVNLFPQPNSSGRFGRFDNFIFGAPAFTNVNAYAVKIDHSFSERNRLSGSYTRRVNDRIVETQSLPVPLEDRARNQIFTTHFYRVAHDYTFSPNLLNHLNLGVNRTISDNQAFGAGEFSSAQIGIPGIDSPLFPSFGFGGGIRNIGNGSNNVNTDNGFRVNDSVSYTRGRHSFKFGGDFRYQQYTPTNQNNTGGNFGFDAGQTAQRAANGSVQGADTGFGFASFLLGRVGFGSLNVAPNVVQHRSNYYAGFVQDDFKVSNNLVLNLGLRYEVDTPRRELHDRQSGFVATLPNPGADNRLGALGFLGDGPGRIGRRSFADTWYKNISPRVGFAYSPNFESGVLNKVLGGAGKTVIRGGYGIYYGALIYAEFGEGLNTGFTGNNNFPSNGFDPAFILDAGFPPFPRPPFIDPTRLNGQGIQAVLPEHGRPPMIQNYSIEVQRELASDLILTVGYVGTNGHHLRSSVQRLDTLEPRFLELGSRLDLRFDTGAAQAAGFTLPYTNFVRDFGGRATVAQALSPYPQYDGINTDCCLENSGNSTYNSLQVKLERRFHDGLNLLASYTFSKTLTDSDSALPIFAQFGGGGSVQNPYDRRGEKALSNQDIPHALVVSYIYELPVGKDKRFDLGNSFLNKTLGGFQIGGVHRYQSGQPISFGCAGGIPGGYGCIRFNRVEGQSLRSEVSQGNNYDPRRDSVFNRAAFVDPNLGRSPNAPFRFGNFPRTTGEVRSPKYYDESLNILKRTPISENVAVEFRTEIFNLFNRAIQDRPNTDVNSPDFGRTFRTANNPRTIQFQLKLLF